jgi:hypothetical protein
MTNTADILLVIELLGKFKRMKNGGCVLANEPLNLRDLSALDSCKRVCEAFRGKFEKDFVKFDEKFEE